jgi:hypothetical protein
VPDSAHREDRASFARWALAALGLTVAEGDRDALVEMPEVDRDAFAGQQRLRLPMAGPSAAGQESLASDGRFWRWLVQRLQLSSPAVPARPARQPMSVAEVAAMLLPAYRADAGQVHLAGCQLTDHPFLRLSYAGDSRDDASIRHVYVAPDGSSVSDELVGLLGLDHLEPIFKLPPRLEDSALDSLLAAGRRIAIKQSTSRDPAAQAVDPIAVAIAWVRHAEGRLQFTFGKKAAALAFGGWASLLEAPPFVGPYSGASAFHLAATDDGRIDVAGEIAACQASGERVLRQDLVECSATGKQVRIDLTDMCPVAGRRALREEFAGCTICRQRVSKTVLEEGACAACRSMAKARKDDPRLVWIIGEHPGLDRWGRWQLAETAAVYIAQAAGLMKRLLVVVDKESLAVRRLALASRLSPAWVDASDAERAELLK